MVTMDVYMERQKDTDTKGVFQMESNGKVALLHMYPRLSTLSLWKPNNQNHLGSRLHVQSTNNVEMEGRQARRKAD